MSTAFMATGAAPALQRRPAPALPRLYESLADVPFYSSQSGVRDEAEVCRIVDAADALFRGRTEQAWGFLALGLEADGNTPQAIAAARREYLALVNEHGTTALARACQRRAEALAEGWLCVACWEQRTCRGICERCDW